MAGGGYGSLYNIGPAQPARAPAKVSSGGYGSRYYGALKAAKPPGPTVIPRHGGGGILGHLWHDTEGAVTNFVPGLVHLAEHPIRGAEQIGHQYAQYYGPLAHGHFGQFAHNVAQHPLQLGLDVTGAATLGAGALADVAELGTRAAVRTGALDAERAGTIRAAIGHGTPESRALVAKGPTGENLTTGYAAKNPIVRLRQQLINKGLNKLPPGTQIIGNDARFSRALLKIRNSTNALPAELQKPGSSLWKAARMNDHQLVAAHLHLQKLRPSDVLQYANDSRVLKAYSNPTRKMTSYMAAYRSEAPLLEKFMSTHFGLSPETMLQRKWAPYMAARGILGDKTYSSGNAFVNAKALEEQTPAVDRPVYVHHQAAERDYYQFAGPSPRAKATNVAMKPGAVKQFTATLQQKGIVNFAANPYSHVPSLVTTAGRNLLHKELVDKWAVPLERIPATDRANWVQLKSKAGEPSLPYMDEKALHSDEWLAHPSVQEGDKINGKVLMIPKTDAKLMQGPLNAPNSALTKFLYNKPTTLWKQLVLGLRPAYAVNIITSQHILAALQSPGHLHQLNAYLDRATGGVFSRGGHIADSTIADIAPEQHAGSYSGNVLVGREIAKMGPLSSRMSGVMPAVLRVENFLRKTMYQGWIKSEFGRDPQFNEVLARNGGDWNKALIEAKHANNPHFNAVFDDVSRRVDHAQGNYRDYSPTEQKLRQIIPFYGWDRHIVQSTYRILSEHPQYAAAGAAVGRQGEAVTQKEFGSLPPYLQGLVHLSGLPKFMGSYSGLVPSILPRMAEPFNEDVNIMRDVQALTMGRAGTQSEALSSMNPIISALYEGITGRNPVTGGTVKDKLPFGVPADALIRVFGETPQARLLETALNKHPWGVGKPSKHPIYKSDIESQLAAYLGVPIKKLNLYLANTAAAKTGQPPK